MEDSPKDNVILFPKTIEYYQLQLTKLLENEQYAEAMELLRFLLQCQAGDPQAREDWRSLLEWMNQSFPELTRADVEEELTESDIHRMSMKEKAEDQQYTKKLLEMLLEHPAMEKKLLALEQLAVVDQPQINMTLKRWLETVELHPIIQFKVLQTLKKRGMRGKVIVEKMNERLKLDIQETPLSMDDYPPPIQAVIGEVVEVSEIHHPALSYFAEHTWKEFLAVVYGTVDYQHVCAMAEREVAAWAAALHYVVTETMVGEASEQEALQAYGVDSQFRPAWDHAVRKIKFFR